MIIIIVTLPPHGEMLILKESTITHRVAPFDRYGRVALPVVCIRWTPRIAHLGRHLLFIIFFNHYITIVIIINFWFHNNSHRWRRLLQPPSWIKSSASANCCRLLLCLQRAKARTNGRAVRDHNNNIDDDKDNSGGGAFRGHEYPSDEENGGHFGVPINYYDEGDEV